MNRFIETLKYSKLIYRNVSELQMQSNYFCYLFLEAVSVGFRSLSLGFRFLANLSAGHVLSDIVYSVKFKISMVSLLSTAAVKIIIFGYEAFVLLVQSSVLVALSLVYADLI